jgi:thiol-disulfide isomerase/thioredoxin
MQGWASTSRSQGCTVTQPDAANTRVRMRMQPARNALMVPWWPNRRLGATGIVALIACALLLPACATTKGGGTPTPEPATPAEQLPTIVLPDLEGRARGLDEFRGQVVLLDFWATWCEPCVDALPVYDELQVELESAGLQVVAVNVDDADAPVADFAQRFAPHLLVLLDPEGATPALLGLKVMPTTWLIDRDGQVVEVRKGFQRGEAGQIRAGIEQLLGVEPTEE